MLLNKNKALAGVSLLSALSVVLLLVGTYLFTNTFFFTALAAYFVGYSVNKYGMKYGGMQLIVCAILDATLNPNKINWALYLVLGSYLFLSEWIFRKWNREDDIRTKMKKQLFYNWLLFNFMYIPVIVLGRHLLLGDKVREIASLHPIVAIVILWVIGQIGWLIYDKAYRVFFQMMRERKL